MKKCDQIIEDLIKEGYFRYSYALLVGGKCKHLLMTIKPDGFDYWAVIDADDHFLSDIPSKKYALELFDDGIPTFTEKSHTQLEDLDATLQELEKNLKIIAVRLLSAVSDFVDKRIERLS